MKNIVIYQSSTGFTKQYAQWIAEDLKCEAIELKKVAQVHIEQYDCIIFGGWIMGNMISGLDKIKKMNLKKMVVFAVGSMPDSEEVREAIREQNGLEKQVFFYMQGGFHFNQLNFVVRMMLKMIKKSIAKKEDKTEQDRYMEKIIGTSFDCTDRKHIIPLTRFVKSKY